jgi:hypothetical protein
MGTLPPELTADKLIQEVVDFMRLRLMKMDFHRVIPSRERSKPDF